MAANTIELAILGATSHIAKGLIERLSGNKGYKTSLFGRSPEKISGFIADNGFQSSCFRVSDYKDFEGHKFDAIINCVGLGDPSKIKNAGADIFYITDTYDHLALKALEINPECIYINFSSGAVYGKTFGKPAEESTTVAVDINHIEPKDYYALAKMAAEFRHRARLELNIVDLRVFSYFSRFIELDAKYLLSDVLRALRDKTEFITGPNNIVRDYIHPQDLWQLVEKCIRQRSMNAVLDVYSRSSITKFELLDYFKMEHGLKVVMTEAPAGVNATGTKDVYYSENHKAEYVGYKPEYSSLDAVSSETRAFFNK